MGFRRQYQGKPLQHTASPPEDRNFWGPRQLGQNSSKESGVSTCAMDADLAEVCDGPARLQSPSRSCAPRPQRRPWMASRGWGQAGAELPAGLPGATGPHPGSWSMRSRVSGSSPLPQTAGSQSSSSCSSLHLDTFLRAGSSAHLLLAAYFMASCSLFQSVCPCWAFKCVCLCPAVVAQWIKHHPMN